MSDLFADLNAEVTVEALVGEGKKYKDVDALAKSRVDADDHIARLQAEMTQMREELSQRLTVEEQIGRLSQRNEQPQTPKAETPPVSQPEELSSRIREALDQREQETKIAGNLQRVESRLLEEFGTAEKAGQMIRSKAAELGVSPQWLRDVGAASPEALFTNLGLVVRQSAQPRVSHSDVNTAGLPAHNGGSRDGSYEFYENLRKTNPRQYFTPKVQNAIHEAVAAGTYTLPE